MSLRRIVSTSVSTSARASLALAIAFVGFDAAAAVTVRYYNKDSRAHSFAAKCRGSAYSLAVNGSTTGSSTIQGGSPCAVAHAGGTVELKGGENIEIKDGKISVK